MRDERDVRTTFAGGRYRGGTRRAGRVAGLVALIGLALVSPGSAPPARAQAEYAGQFAGNLFGDLSGSYVIQIEADAVSSTISGTLRLPGAAPIPLSGGLDGNAFFSGLIGSSQPIFFDGAFIGTDRISGTWIAGNLSGTFDGVRVAENVPEVATAQALTALNAAGGQRNNFYRRIENLRSGGAGLSTAGLSLELPGITLSSDMLTSGAPGLARLVRGLGLAFDSPGAAAPRGRASFAGDGIWRGPLPDWTSPASGGRAAAHAQQGEGVGAAGSGGVALIPDYGLFLNGTVSLSDRSASLGQGGFDATTFGLSTGLDRRLGDWLVAGVGLGYTRDDTDFDIGGGSETNAVYGVLYGTASPWRDAYVDGVLSVGWIGFDNERVAAPGLLARGETNGAQLFGGLTGGYGFAFGATTLSPYARLNGGSTWVADYVESGAGPATLAYGDATIWSLSTVLALRADHSIATPVGVVVPYVRAEYEHEFGDAPRSEVRPWDGSFAIAPVFRGRIDRDFFNVGGGVSAIFPRAWSGFVDYDGLFGADRLTRHSITAGVRREF